MASGRRVGGRDLNLEIEAPFAHRRAVKTIQVIGRRDDDDTRPADFHQLSEHDIDRLEAVAIHVGRVP